MSEIGFDLRTHVRDKTGRVVERKPYKLHIIDGVRTYERDGRFFHEDGSETASPFPKSQKVNTPGK